MIAMVGDALWCLVVAAEVVALTLCLTHSVIRKSELTAVLAVAIAIDVLSALGKILILDGAPRPFVGIPRLWYHTETLLMLGWPVWLSLTIRRSFVFPGAHQGPSAMVLGAWIGMSVGLAIVYPTDSIFVRRVFLFVEAISVAAAWLAVWQGWARAWSRSVVHISLLVMLCFESVVLVLGPFSHDLYRDWPLLARVPYMLSFGTVAWLLARRRK